MRRYNIKYDTQCKDAGESMPLGGHDLGCNVWVEKNILYIYMAQSGAFDETGNMVKAGRLKIELFPNPYQDSFSQELVLEDGNITILGKNGRDRTKILLWVDVKYGGLHIQIDSETTHKISLSYENWRNSTNRYPSPDVVTYDGKGLTFIHKNGKENHFWTHIREEELEEIASEFPNIQDGLVFGGRVCADGMEYIGKEGSSYAGLFCDSYRMEGVGRRQDIDVHFHISRAGNEKEWLHELEQEISVSQQETSLEQDTREWWRRLWERSYVHIKPGNTDVSDREWQVGRNYQLFRYMLACNAYGEYPTKFNGGLFTIDPCFWGARYGASTPDERDWGGIIFTAQNQRHVYWPMLKNGDYDMMKPQFEFYFRLLNGAKARTNHFFGVKNAACIPEQTDANGLSAFYGLNGLDYPIHVRYHYVTAVEFGYMMLQYLDQTGETEVGPYIDFISAIINFYDQKYSKLDENGKRIIFPSTAQETYHKGPLINIWGEEGRYAANYNEEEVAVTNPADVIYALRAVLKFLLDKGYGDRKQREIWERLLNELSPIPLENKKGHTVIAPCEKPVHYLKANCEFPQLYAAYPYHEIGIGESNDADLLLARDTYKYGWDEEDQLMNLSWMYMGLFAARLGLTDEAVKYQFDKLKSADRRFPAFWGPGHDYTPDHNWGGCGIQEMLMQNFGGKIYLLPAWPKGLDVQYRLWVDKDTSVEVSYIDGKLDYVLSNESRQADVIVCV